MIRTIKNIFKIQGEDPNKREKPKTPQPKGNEPKQPNKPNNNVPPKGPNETRRAPTGRAPKKIPNKKPNVWLTALLFFLIFMLIFGIFFGNRLYAGSYDHFLSNVSSIKKGEYAAQWYYGYYIRFHYLVEGKTYVISFDGMQHMQTFWKDFNILLPMPPVTYYTGPSFFAQLLTTWLPWVIMMVVAFTLIRKVTEKQHGAGKIAQKSLTPQISNIKFKDVAGYEEIKEELIELVDFLKQPQKYAMAGARVPKGIMLSGPPGTGKTMFAKAVAGEAMVPFYSISGSDFVEMFVGVGASRVRALFAQAKKTAPALIFIDELDAVGRMRGAGLGGGNDEREQTLNQLLVEMDGFSQNSGIMIMAATNRPDVLDPALKRPGRFDRAVELRLPDYKERQSILEIYAKQGNKKFEKSIDWSNISQRTPGFSGAELENVMNEAAILSIRLNSPHITLDIIDEAIDRVIAGPSKTNNSMSKEEKTLIAHHEAGHAIIGLVDANAEKVQKISIVPRGPAGGYVLMTPKKEKFIQTKAELISKITSYMGGRVAEEIFFGKDSITTGAYSDIQEATKIARRMVTEFGMSDLGPIQYEKPQGSVFLGRDFSSEKNSSSQVQYEIDQQVRKLIDKAYKKAIKIISDHKVLILLFSEALMLKETLNAEEAEYIFKNKKLTDQIIEIKEKTSTKTKDTKT